MPRATRLLLAISSALCLPGCADEAARRAPLDAQPVQIESRLDADDIEAHLSDPHSVEWVKVASLMLDADEACVDGRDTHAVIGTPGGDLGELLLALATIERLRGTPLSTGEVEELFGAYAQSCGRFYMHTDARALETLARDLQNDPRVTATVSLAGGIEPMLRAPPPALRDELLDALTAPAHIGCGHLSLVATRPDAYGVRAGLTRTVLREFYRRLWAGDSDMDLVVLEGDHREGAIVDVTVDGPLHAYSRVPMIAPLAHGSEVFVHHPQVVSFLRREFAALFVERAGLDEAGIDPAAFVDGVEALGARQLELTLESLAVELPVYELHFSGREHRVRRVG